MNAYLQKMLLGLGDIQKYPYSVVPCHFNTLGPSRSITFEQGLCLLNWVRWAKPAQVVELGTFRGYSTAWLLLGTLLNEYGKVDSYDIKKEGYYGSMWYQYYELPRDNFYFHHLAGSAFLEDLLPDKIDFVFHDSSHELEDTERELSFLYSRMSERGIMIFDDMTHPDYRPMQSFLNRFFLSAPLWRWSVLPIGTGFGIAERVL